MEVSKGIFGAVTLVLIGVMLASAWTHPEGVKQLGASLDSITKTAYSGMLGGNTSLQ